MRRDLALSPVALLLGLVATAGCVLFAAGAGAGGAIYFTGRGVESVVPASVQTLFDASERAFEEFEIQRTSYTVEDDGARRRLEGRSEREDADVTVSMERTEAGNTRVQVSAQTSPVTWDKEFAREIMERIVELAE